MGPGIGKLTSWGTFWSIMSQKLFLPRWLDSSYEIKWVTPAQIMLQSLFTLSEKLILTFAKGDLKLWETKHTDIIFPDA